MYSINNWDAKLDRDIFEENIIETISLSIEKDMLVNLLELEVLYNNWDPIYLFIR